MGSYQRALRQHKTGSLAWAKLASQLHSSRNYTACNTALLWAITECPTYCSDCSTANWGMAGLITQIPHETTASSSPISSCLDWRASLWMLATWPTILSALVHLDQDSTSYPVQASSWGAPQWKPLGTIEILVHVDCDISGRLFVLLQLEVYVHLWKPQLCKDLPYHE